MEIEKVLNYLRVSRDLKPETLRNIARALSCLPSPLTQELAESYIFSLEKSKITINSYIVSFNHYVDYLTDNRIEHNFRKIKTRRVVTKPINDFLSTSEIKSLIEAPVAYYRDSEYLKGMYASFFLFIALTGCRVSEAINLKSKDVSLAKGYAWLRDRKNGHDLKVLLPPPVVKAIAPYCVKTHVFTSTTGQMLDKTSVRDEMKRRALKVGIDPTRAHPHILRHSFCSELLAQGNTIETVAKMVGHEKLDTTYKHYAHLLDSTLRSALNTHPLVKDYLTPQEIIKQDLEVVKKLRMFNDPRFTTKLIEGSHSLELLVAVK